MINVEINIIGVKNLITAEEAHEKAMIWRNEELQSCLSNLMEQIDKTANKGKLFGEYKVLSGKPYEFYETLQKALESLGFIVNPPNNPHTYSEHEWKWWKISW
jgi:hypothetical protein